MINTLPLKDAPWALAMESGHGPESPSASLVAQLSYAGRWSRVEY
jgi:hypothetical protein